MRVPMCGAGAIAPNGRKSSIIVGMAVQPACTVNSIARGGQGCQVTV
ncbi:hypothetical protein [Tychonema sp. BBK16]|nr:hypothetical protein [Tychonema sp. BBK16]MCF6374035.1 hypothetical protein [Tychonema sp. BBK16]